MSFHPVDDYARLPSNPPPPPSHTVVTVADDALPEEPTVPIGPILVAADGELVFFSHDRIGGASLR